MEVLTPIKTIRVHCIECSGGQKKEVKECPITKCPLYPYRMGKRPKKDVSIDKVELASKSES